MLIIPAIDLKGGRPVRLVEGREDSATTYDKDPVAIALDYEVAGAGLIHIVDLDAALASGRSHNRALIREIARSVKIPVEVGGGIRNIRDIDELVNEVGVRFAVLGTLAVEQPRVVAEAVLEFGDSIVVGIDARGREVSVRGWTQSSSVDAVSLARSMVEIGIGRIIYTDITRDGKLEGPNVETTRVIAASSGAKVTASGGISCLQDLNLLSELEAEGCDSCIIGKALYEGRFTLAEAIRSLES